jgi:hypothetical protein
MRMTKRPSRKPQASNSLIDPDIAEKFAELLRLREMVAKLEKRLERVERTLHKPEG